MSEKLERMAKMVDLNQFAEIGPGVYSALYKGRQIMARHMDMPLIGPYWTGYAEVLPEDHINVFKYMDYDDVFYAPGGLTFGGSFPVLPGKTFLGFYTANLGVHRFGLRMTLAAAMSLVDQIEDFKADWEEGKHD